MLPKRTYRPTLEIIETTEGPMRVDQLLRMTDPNTTLLPRSMDMEDLDGGMVEYLEKQIALTLDGKPVPVIFMTNERWGEFSKTWMYLDEDKNPIAPIVTVRRVGKGPGSNSGVKFNIPKRKTFSYLKVPKSENGQTYYDIYKIPQPVFIDMVYDVMIFSPYLTDINEMDKLILTQFTERYSFTEINGHFVPLLLDDMQTPDSVENEEGDRLLTTTYNMRLQGYMVNPDEFEKVSTIKSVQFNYHTI